MSRENSELEMVWADRIKAQRASGKPVKEWCTGEGVSPNTFQGWVKRLGMQSRKKRAGAFVRVVPPVASARTPEAKMSDAEMICVTLIRLKLPACFGSDAITELVQRIADQ